jgi:hypothetical protein
MTLMTFSKDILFLVVLTDCLTINRLFPQSLYLLIKARDIEMNDELKELLRSVLKDCKHSLRFVELIIKARNYGLDDEEKSELKRRCQKTIEGIDWELNQNSSFDYLDQQQIKEIIDTPPYRKINESDIFLAFGAMTEEEQLQRAKEILEKQKNKNEQPSANEKNAAEEPKRLSDAIWKVQSEKNNFEEIRKITQEKATKEIYLDELCEDGDENLEPTDEEKIAIEQALKENKRYSLEDVFCNGESEDSPFIEENKGGEMKIFIFNDVGKEIKIHPATKVYLTKGDFSSIQPLEERTFYLPQNANPLIKLWDNREDRGLQILVSPNKCRK